MRSTYVSISLIALSQMSCGKALPFEKGDALGDAVLSIGGGTRVDGTDIGSIYPVTQVVTAVPGHTFPNDSYLPLILGYNGAPGTGTPPKPNYSGFNDLTQNTQVPFYYTFTYPPNNYRLASAHLAIDTQRDNTDTEGIFVDGVMTGYPPGGTSSGGVNTSSPGILYHDYNIGGTSTVQATDNIYYIDYSLKHYKYYKRNSFDLDIAQIINKSPLTAVDVVKDGLVQVVTGDDSPIFQAALFLKGVTVSKDPLSCVTSPSYTFQNVQVHDDGNTIGQSAFTGTVYTPFQSSTSTGSAFQSVEFNYDVKLPNVDLAKINVNHAYLRFAGKKSATASDPKAAVVINGVAVYETGFDTSKFNPAAVESYETGSGQVYFESTFLPSLPASITAPTFSTASPYDGALTLDLVQLLGAARVKTLLAQGKLNIAFGGSISYLWAQSGTRSKGVAVNGPDFYVDGDYYTDLCTVPNNPDSPLNDTSAGLPDVSDHSSPIVSSNSASEITSSSAAIQWLTNEDADSQVCYGVGNTSTCTPVTDTSPKVTFHRVVLSGLSPYKVYQFKVISVDASPNLNSTTSGIATFQTLR